MVFSAVGNSWNLEAYFYNGRNSFILLSLGIIECGTACAAQFNGGCDLYAPKKDSKLCHIGYFDNTNSNYLTGESGINPVYINLSKYT